MDASFSPEELAFRDEVQAFIREKLPEDLAAKTRQGLELGKDDYRRWMQILGAQAGFVQTGQRSMAAPVGM